MTKEERESRGQSGRDWAIKNGFTKRELITLKKNLIEFTNQLIKQTPKIIEGPKTLVKLVEWNTVDGSPYHIERVPIHIRCGGCGSSMSNTETDLADVLSKLCLRCFCEQTDQEYTWHSKPWWQVNGGKYNGGPLIH